jgi:hypothetical protein
MKEKHNQTERKRRSKERRKAIHVLNFGGKIL